MFSVSPEIYRVLVPAARWLFAFFALMLLFFAFSWLHSERKKRRELFRSLPEAGHIGELVVISGSSRLPVDTWFPVPREGVLGSLRSCDLVVPCPGVRGRHLSFSWQDGTGLIIRPYAGCEVFVDGVPLAAAGRRDLPVMLHGSCLQVGSTVLRLQLLSALEHTNRPFTAAAPAGYAVPEAAPPFPDVPLPQEPALPPVDSSAPYPAVPPYPPEIPAGPYPDGGLSAGEQADARDPAGTSAPAEHPPVPQDAPRRRRADRWKEDFGE